MTPLQFEQQYQGVWQELEELLAKVIGPKAVKQKERADLDGERIAELYRRSCEHLALARARSYPAYLLDRLERLTGDAHQAIYQHRQLEMSGIKDFFAFGFPQAVRDNAVYVWIATAAFMLPTIVIGWLVYHRPDLVLSVIDAGTAAQMEAMYSPTAESIGRARDADTDWAMFGFYIRNNITVAFQCFASGLLLGVGSLFFLALNGAFGGAVGGYLIERGLSSTFLSFVATHAAFELTAIFLSGAVGLRLGHAVLAPKRQTRVQALVQAARESMPIVYGFTIMLVIAAVVEAFWSSARWMPNAVKYSVAAACWLGVFCYFMFQGRRAS